MGRSLFIQLLVTCIASSALGCSSEVATAIERRETTLTAETEADPEDAFGTCIVIDDPYDAFPFDCTNPDAACTGWGGGGFCENVGGETLCEVGPYHVVCDPGCETSDDCTAPSTGDVVPVCHETFCQLPCDDDTTCPDGFSCTSTVDQWTSSALPRLCMQTFNVAPHGLADAGTP